MAGSQRNNDDTSAVRAYGVAPGDLMLSVVPALHENVGMQRGDKFRRGVFVKDDDDVDHRERRKHIRALLLAANGTLRSFAESAHGGIAIHTNNEYVAFGPRAAQHVDVPRVEQVKDAVREHDFAALRGTPSHQRGPIKNSRARVYRLAQNVPTTWGENRNSRTMPGSSTMT